ncbi:MAG: hypothetical protein P1V81_04865 [Planctomycetota bacterium]|nr:hypothetical protein [Planctomycetota bacterium]
MLPRTLLAGPHAAALTLLASLALTLAGGLTEGLSGRGGAQAAAGTQAAEKSQVAAGTKPAAEAQAPSGTKPAAEPIAVDLLQLRKDPLRYRGERVALTVQLGDERETWTPGLTRFDRRRFRGFAAWSETSRLWHIEPYSDPLPALFARRGGSAARALAGAGSYGRLELVAIVRTVFGGEVWIEVLEARRLPRSVGEGSLIHAGRAVELYKEGHHAAAAAEYERALAAPLPDSHRAALEEERDKALKRAAD